MGYEQKEELLNHLGISQHVFAAHIRAGRLVGVK